MTQPANKRFLMEDRLPWPAEDLGTDSVTTDKILDGAVTSAKIANGTIIDADVNASAAIAKTKIAGTAVTLADTGTVTSTMIANGTIVEADLADGAVTSAKIADGTIVDADINTAAAIASTKVQGTIPTGGTSGQVLAKSTSSDFATTWVDGTALPASQVKQIVKNETGSTIPKGSVVYYSGANGTNILISLASASTEDTSSKTVGFTEAAINNGASGFVVSEGLIAGLNTSAATAGQSVWLGTTAGSFVYGAPPAKPAHSVYLGLVTKANPSTGEIFVKVQNGYELEELHNVNISTPVNGQALTYDSASQLWKNATPVSSLAGLSDVAFTSPQTGEVVKYNGTTGKWVNGTAGGGINTTEPVPSSNGDGWFYNEDGSLFIRYNDGTSSQWVQAMVPPLQTVEQRYYSPNYVINGAFDIWQRGTSLTHSGATAGYSADRWYSNPSGGTMTVSRQSFTVGQTDVPGEPTYFARIACTTGDNNLGVGQRIEDVRTFAGQTVTVSFYAKGTNPAGGSLRLRLIQYFGTGGSANVESDVLTFSVGSTWTRYTATVAVPSIAGKTIGADSYVSFDWRQPATDTGTAAWTLDVANAQVELGSTATTFRRNGENLAAELAACQRYYRHWGADQYISDGPTGMIMTNNLAFFPLPGPMRVAPSIDAATTYNVGIYNATNLVVAGGTVTMASHNNAQTPTVSYTHTSGVMPIGQACLLNTTSPAGWSLGLSAEL